MRLQDRPTLPRRRRGALQGFLRRRTRGARDRAGRPLSRRTAASSIPPRPTTPAPATARVAIMVLAFESADHDARRLDRARARMLRRSRRRAGERAARGSARATAPPASGATPSSACPMRASGWSPRGIIADTFETAITWDRFEDIPRRGQDGDRDRDPRGDRPRRPGHLPLHPRLSRRTGALLLLPRTRPARRS